MPEPELEQSFETIEGYQRKSWCDIEGEGIKKWKEALIVLKNNLLYVYKNETAKSPSLLIGLDKCLVMTAEEYDGKTHVIQLKTETGRIFCISLPPMEELSEWVTDIKGSDYSSLKEKVTTLELGLKTIGEGQNQRMKTDQEKVRLQEQQRAILSMSRIQSELRFQIMYQTLMKWKTAQELQTMKQHFEEVQRDKTKYYERELVLLREQSTNVEKEATEKMKSVSYDCRQYIYESGVHRLNRFFSDEKQFKQLLVLLMWKEQTRLRACQEAAQKEKDALAAEVETVLKSTITERDGALKALEEEAESVKKQMAEEARSHEDLVKEHAGMKDVLEQVMQAKEAVEAQNRQLIEQIEQNTASLATFQEAANGSEEEATAVVARLQIEVNELKSKLERSQKDEEEYRRKWEMLQDFSVEELSRAQKKIDEYTVMCESLVKQVEEANNGEKLTSLLKEKEELDARVKELEVQVQATTDVVSNSSEMAMERENEMELVKEKTDALTLELAETKEKKEAAEKELKETKKASEERIRALEEKNADQKKELATLKRRVLALKNMEESMKDIEDLLQQREAQLRDVLERIKAAEKTSEECKKEVKKYEARNAELEHQMQNYTFREGAAGEVVEKVVEVQKDKPETLARVQALEAAVAKLEEEKAALEAKQKEKEEEEAKQKERDEEFKQKKVLPLKLFPLYPSLRPREEETAAYVPKVVKVEVEERAEEEAVGKYEGRNPDVVKREEEERRRKEEEERKRKEEEERKKREEEERKRKEEEERKRREEEEKRRKEEEERKRKEEEERKRKEEEERKKREEEERKRQEEEERRKEEEKKEAAPNPFDEPSVEKEEPAASSNPFDQPSPEEEEPATSNPFDEPSVEEHPVTSPNPFDQPSPEDEEPAASSNPFDQHSAEEESAPASNPFDQPSDEPETAASNPFDEPVQEPEVATSNPFDQPSAEEEKPAAASNPFDQPSDEHPVSTDSFTQPVEDHATPVNEPSVEPANPFDQPSAEPANPFDQPSAEPANPFDQPSAEPANPFDQPSVEPAAASQPADSLFDLTPAQPADPFAQPTNSSAQTEAPQAASPNLFGASPAAPAQEDPMAFDFSSVVAETEKASKPSLWKRKKSEKKEESESGESKKKWGFGSKQVDAIKGGMGRFGHMLKSAAAKGQTVIGGKKGEEPEFFPDMDMSDLENGFDAKAVKYFFAHWNTSTDEKIRLRAWMAPILNNEILSHDVLAGYTIKGASSFVEGAFRLCISPLLNLRKDISVDFIELPNEEGTFELDIKLRMKDDPMENLLGFE